MELKNKEMLEYLGGTSTMLEKRLPLKLAFAVKHNRKEMLHKLEPFEEVRLDLVERFPNGEDEEGQKEFDLLMEESVEVDVKKVPMEVIELTDTEGYDKLTLGELEAIDIMIEE